MVIRLATEKDIPAINDLLYQVLDVHYRGRPDLFKGGAKKYTDEELTEIIENSNTPVFVADIDEKFCGYAFCIFQRPTDSHILTDVKTLYIDDLCVDACCRGKGIGTALYDFVVSFAKTLGCYNVTLNVWTCNSTALRFYEKCGLRPQKIGLEKIL